MSTRPRVLVVDDSAFARKVLRTVLSDDDRIEVVGFARDGLDALEKISELAPDVITLDLVMPGLDGSGVLEALRSHAKPPRVVVVTMSDAVSPLAIAALQAGAFDVVHKPTALATDQLYDLRSELVEKVLLAAGAQAPARAMGAPLSPSTKGSRAGVPTGAEIRTRIVVIGTSTGGPRALTLLFGALPAAFPVPIATVVHMPTGFTQGLALRLDGDSALEISEARDGQDLKPGTVAIARAGTHLSLASQRGACVAVLGAAREATLHRPSVDVLFQSAAAAFGSSVLGVVLTGMGSDGLAGARAIRAAGGQVLVEAASTCVVHGMPRTVEEAGLATAVVPLHAMAEALLAHL